MTGPVVDHFGVELILEPMKIKISPPKTYLIDYILIFQRKIWEIGAKADKYPIKIFNTR